MTAWIAGLSFLSANLGSLELMGWAAAAYQYGILATHWYWIGAIPAMLFLGIVMMPFYYISKTHSVPGYLQLRFGEASRGLAAVSFGFMTVLMSGINMYSMALVMKVVLGWDINFSIWVSSITVAIYVALGGLRSAIFNEVLQFVLIWLGALLIPILGLIEAGGWSGLQARIAQNFPGGDYTHLWSTLGSFSDNPMGIHWTGIVLGLGWVISFGYWTTDFLVVQRVLAAKDLRSAKMAPIIGAAFKMMVPFIVILPGLLGLALLPVNLVGEAQAVATGGHSYNEVLPLMLARYCGPGLLGLGITALIAGFMSGMAGNVSAFATVWTYDIYRAFIKKDAARRALRQHGPLVHHPRRADQHRHRLPGDAVPEHHGLRAGAVQLLHRAAVRHGAARHAVEARHAGGRLLGPAGRHGFLDRHVGLGQARSQCAVRHRALQQRQGHGREHVPRPVELDHLRAGDGGGQLSDQAQTGKELVGLVYGCTEIPSEGHLPLYQRPIFWAGDRLRRLRGLAISSSGRTSMANTKEAISIWFFMGVLLTDLRRADPRRGPVRPDRGREARHGAGGTARRRLVGSAFCWCWVLFTSASFCARPQEASTKLREKLRCQDK